MSESSFWRWLRPRLPEDGDYVRVENSVGPGTPDVNYCIGGLEGWIELKFTKTFPLRHPISPDQVAWIRRRTSAGGHACVIIGTPKLIFFIAGRDVSLAINAWTLDDFLKRSNKTFTRSERVAWPQLLN